MVDALMESFFVVPHSRGRWRELISMVEKDHSCHRQLSVEEIVSVAAVREFW